MDQPKIKNVYDKIRKFINSKYKFCYFVKTYNFVKIAKQCKDDKVQN